MLCRVLRTFVCDIVVELYLRIACEPPAPPAPPAACSRNSVLVELLTSCESLGAYVIFLKLSVKEILSRHCDFNWPLSGRVFLKKSPHKGPTADGGDDPRGSAPRPDTPRHLSYAAMENKSNKCPNRSMVNGPAQPVRYRTLTEYRHEVTVAAVHFVQVRPVYRWRTGECIRSVATTPHEVFQSSREQAAAGRQHRPRGAPGGVGGAVARPAECRARLYFMPPTPRSDGLKAAS
ncbi:hypothetical protein EVAR_85447_1 [Eumeta japonica]|uniref:Uncharacterized protein n=1 Tax=Eumeta variegata TaxID=151549 RepID=A0A4C1WM93_EUMVA|nr:hypothetical protein EVAR_85447_1 [Eumeta japonica]